MNSVVTGTRKSPFTTLSFHRKAARQIQTNAIVTIPGISVSTRTGPRQLCSQFAVITAITSALTEVERETSNTKNNPFAFNHVTLFKDT